MEINYIVYDTGHIAESPEIGTLAEIAKGLYGWDFRERLNFKPGIDVNKQREGLAEIILHEMDLLSKQRFEDAVYFHLNKTK